MRWWDVVSLWFAGLAAVTGTATLVVAVGIGARQIRLARESLGGRALGFTFNHLEVAPGRFLHEVVIDPTGPATFVNFAVVAQHPGANRDSDRLLFGRSSYSHIDGRLTLRYPAGAAWIVLAWQELAGKGTRLKLVRVAPEHPIQQLVWIRRRVWIERFIAALNRIPFVELAPPSKPVARWASMPSAGSMNIDDLEISEKMFSLKWPHDLAGAEQPMPEFESLEEVQQKL